MKNFIKNKLLSLLYFIEVYFKPRTRNKTSPIDIYYEKWIGKLRKDKVLIINTNNFHIIT